jgi:hypothetical protein
MKLADSIRILASIANDATSILHKKIGKTKGLDSIEKQIRDTATSAAERTFGGELDRVAKVHIDRYVAKRMKYMRNAFKKLDNPKTDTSKQRGEFIGETESRSAKAFGATKGYERLAKSRNKNIYKSWVTNGDGCPTCEANEDDGPIPIDEDFTSGDYAPQAHPECDCTLEFTDDDDNEVDLDYDEEGED